MLISIAAVVLLQVSVIASVEVELEAAIEKCKGAEKELAKSLRELAKAIAAEQNELKKYQPGEGRLQSQCS
jgi:prefoldin subunit 5